MTLTIQSKFHPRSYQIPILRALNSGINRAIWCCHRRAGKDVTILNWCIEQLIKETCTCYYILPKYSQAKKVIWDATNNEGFRILDYFPAEIIAQKNQQEMKIRLNNGSLFQLIGSDNIDSLMGTNPKIVVFSEYALQTTDAWDFIRPILKVNGGTAIFISCVNPKTLVITEDGLKRIENVSKSRKEYSDLNKNIWGLNGFNNATDFYYGEIRKL